MTARIPCDGNGCRETATRRVFRTYAPTLFFCDSCAAAATQEGEAAE